MRPYALWYLYRRRLRAHAVQEALAGTGIAVAVALVFATLVAQGSIAGSAKEVVHAVIGPANLQIRTRSEAGFPEGLLHPVKKLPGVKQAAPLLEQNATIEALNGRRASVVVAGADTSVAVMDGLAKTLPLGALAPGGLGLSKATAQALGVNSSEDIKLDLDGQAYTLKVGAVLGEETAGALSKAAVAVMSLKHLQRLAGKEGKVSRILVQSEAGKESEVRTALQTVVGQGREVAKADQDVALLGQALGPSRLASGLFAAIGALLGLLLAFNAMLLTVPERRRAIADLRVEGTTKRAVVQMVLFQAVCLGMAATLVGLGAGYGLSVGVFHQSSKYLAEAFTLAGGTVVGVKPLLIAGLGGVAATCVASGVPLLDMRKGKARDSVYTQAGVPGNALSKGAQWRMFAGAMALVALASALFAVVPEAAIGAVAALAGATVLAVPLVFGGVIAVAGKVAARNQTLTSLPVALAALKGTTVRSLALAGTGAVALFGSVALGGSRENLLKGIESFSHSYVADADIWVSNPGDNQATEQFAPTDNQTTGHLTPTVLARRIAQLPGVARVQTDQGAFMKMGGREAWVLARPPGGAREVIGSETLQENPNTANARLGERGWVVLSEQLAQARKAHLGGTLILPTPHGPKRFRLAATTTNLAWPPGVVFMSSKDFAADWGSETPSALAITLKPGADPQAVRSTIANALGKEEGLEVALASTRERNIDALTSEGLGQLEEIATLLLIAAVAAMAAALSSAAWQRRAWLAGLRLSGAKPGRLRRVLAIEAGLMLGAGCVTGALMGVYGQVVIDAYLKRVTGFPLARSLAATRPLELLALVLVASLALAMAPAWAASKVPPSLALQDE